MFYARPPTKNRGRVRLMQKRVCECVRGLLILWFWFTPSAWANFAPFAAISVASSEGYAGEPFQFSSAGSVDPDGQPQPLSFRWDFGDGSSSFQENPRHAFSRAGAFSVSVEVSDGADQSVASLVVIVLDRPTAGSPQKSGPICFNGDETEVWAVNPDSGTVSVFAVINDRLAKVEELPSGKFPRTIACDASTGRIFVTCQEANEVWVIDGETRKLLRKLSAGHLPYGVCVAPVSGKIIVSNQGNGTLHVFSADLSVEAVLKVAENPRALAVTADGVSAYVTHFLTTGSSALVTEIDLLTNTVRKEIPLIEDQGPDSPSSSKGFPNLLSALAIEPAGKALWVGGYKSNTGRGSLRSGENLTPFNTVRGFFGRIDLALGQEEVLRRIDPNNADSISSIAFSPNGRFAYVTHQGAETLSIYDVITSELIKPGDGNTVPFVSRIDVGSAPQGLLAAKDGRLVFVANYLSRNIMVIDVSDETTPRLVQTIESCPEPLTGSIANGKRLFYSSKAPRHSKDNYIACASCHADGGGSDRRTWDFTGKGEGLRNTMDLRGKSGLAHGPLHWSGNFDEIQDFENDIVNSFGGLGLASDGKPPNPPLGAKNAGRSKDLDDLAAYVSSLAKAPASPFRRKDGTLTVAALRGKALFTSDDLGCVQCHSSPAFTDSFLPGDSFSFLSHDVGTLQFSSGTRLNEPLVGIDTPSLLGLWASAPYLHDGSASSLKDVLVGKNIADKHGLTSTLKSGELDDLIAYLLSLDDASSPDMRVDSDGDSVSDSWEKLYNFDPLNPIDGKLDSDGDGASNAEEFHAATNPTDRFSVLKVFFEILDSGETKLSFETVGGVQYVVESINLVDGMNWESPQTVRGDGSAESLVAPSLEAKRFFRLRVVPDE